MRKTVATVIAISMILSLSSQTFAEVQESTSSSNNVIVLEESPVPDDAIIHSMDPLDPGNIAETNTKTEVTPVQEVKVEDTKNTPTPPPLEVNKDGNVTLPVDKHAEVISKEQNKKNESKKSDKEKSKEFEKKIKELLNEKKNLQIKLKRISKDKKNKYKIDKQNIEFKIKSVDDKIAKLRVELQQIDRKIKPVIIKGKNVNLNNKSKK